MNMVVGNFSEEITMPGKLAYNEDANKLDANPKQMTAYCEGRSAAAAGLLIADNPTPSEDTVLAAYWDAGHASWTADPDGMPTKDCCDLPYGGGFVPE
jgi:hypothetical protein